MTLSAGTRLGPYEVLSTLGAGGMGEVYRARDARLGREVAVKVLPEELARDPERLRRFEGEARAASALSDPHIVAVFDVGEAEGVHYFATELVEGSDLRHLLDGGPLPLKKALDLAGQIASGLAAAHEKGIVHRDLKPENILVTKSGLAKIADFGLAKLTESKEKGVSQLPTSDGRQTTAGVVMGTITYMSPEQVKGLPVDYRSDIFSFGVVLDEMLTGAAPFQRATAAETMAAILKEDPASVSSRRRSAAPGLDRVISTCLAKDPKDRWQSAHDLRLELGWIAAGEPQAGLAAPGLRRRAVRERLIGGAIVAAALAAALFATFHVRRAPGPREVVRFQAAPPAGASIVGAPVLSPDGRFLAFTAVDEGGARRIWVRALDSVAARPLAGTEGSFRPFWSPDSRFLGFDAGGKLKKIAVAGGPPETICDASVWGAQGTWSDDGTIVFDWNDTLRRISPAGGVSTVLVRAKNGGIAWPHFLPGGKRLLYLELSSAGKLVVYIANADGRDVHEVMSGVSRVEYAPPGYLLFVRDTTLLAQRFDAATGTLGGEPIPIAADVATDPFGNASFSTSRNGVLAYQAGSLGDVQYVWVDREGHRSAAVAEPKESANFDLSPDARWLVYDAASLEGFEIWLDDLKRGVASRFSVERGADLMCPLFTRDSREIVYSRQTGKSSRLVARAFDGRGEKVLHEDSAFLCAEALSPDGETLLFDRAKGDDRYDLWQLRTNRPKSAAPLIASKSSTSRASISPDGRWMAFQDDDSGRNEVYVTALSGSGARWQISTSGGREPEWGPSGLELFYVSLENQMIRVAVRTGASFDAGDSRPLFTMAVSPTLGRNRYLVARDGTRFLVQWLKDERGAAPANLVLNWDRALPR